MKIALLGLILNFSITAFANHQIEFLLGNGFDRRGVYIQVFDGGCTNRDSFHFKTQTKDNLKVFTFYRIMPDNCRAFYRYGSKIYFSFEELGIEMGASFTVANPRSRGIRN